MRLVVCAYIMRDGQALFRDQPPVTELDILHVPCAFLEGEMTALVAAQRLIKRTIGLYPHEVFSSGIIQLRHPQRQDINVSVWGYQDRSIAPPSLDGQPGAWLAVEPELSPEIPEPDRRWLSFILAKTRFTAEVKYQADGQFSVRVRADKGSSTQPPQE